MTPLQQIILAIVVAIIGSTAVANLVIFFVTRGDTKKGDIAEIKQDIAEMKTEIKDIKDGQQEAKAATARLQILNFAEDLANGKEFVKAHYDDVYEAMNIYNHYCDHHPDFKNDLTTDSQEFIRTRYQEHLDDGSFMKY